MYWTWIIVSCIISLAAMFLFVCAGWVHLFGTGYTSSGRTTEARISLAGFAVMVLSWLWPLVLPVALIIGFVLIVKGAVAKESE